MAKSTRRRVGTFILLIAATVTYFIPLVSIAIGVIGLREPLAWNAPAGAAIIVAGSLVSRAR